MVAESFNDALVECIKACGGSKVVGVALWPAMGVEAAQRKLLACMNPDHHEKLSPDEVLMVLRLARERGCHVGIEFVCLDLGYTVPKAVSKEDQRAELQRRFIEVAANLQAMAAQLKAMGVEQ